MVRLIGVRGDELGVEDVAVVDGTPPLDIKPYVPAFDDPEGTRIGWFMGKLGRIRDARAGDRFRRAGTARGTSPARMPDRTLT